MSTVPQHEQLRQERPQQSDSSEPEQQLPPRFGPQQQQPPPLSGPQREQPPSATRAHRAPGTPLAGRRRPISGDIAAARPLLDGSDVARVLSRMAHEILEKTGGGQDVVLLGIPTRGVTLAHRLADRMLSFEGRPVPVGSLDITLHRDDLRLRGVRPLQATDVPVGGIDGKVVVLVDDVLFSGRSVRAALDALGDLGRPRIVQLAVLVDRGHRELPVRADYVGKNVPTSLHDAVHVLLTETDGSDAVLLGPADTEGVV